MLKALAAPLVSKPTNGWHSTFTAWTTRVSNPVCSPRFRSSASVSAQRPAFATGVPPDICAFHRYTRNSSLPYRTLVLSLIHISEPTRLGMISYAVFCLKKKKKKTKQTYNKLNLQKKKKDNREKLKK